MHVNVSTTFETMDQALSEIEALGLPIHITELDVNIAAGGQRNTVPMSLLARTPLRAASWTMPVCGKRRRMRICSARLSNTAIP